MKTAIFILAMFPLMTSMPTISAQSEEESIPERPAVIFVKGGTFQMGNNEGKPDEVPEHNVTLHDFSIGKYPVTVKQYKMFCAATNRKMPKAPKWGWHDNHPIVNITYDDAQSYCNWLSQQYGGGWRLPTEAEWEYAAGGGHTDGHNLYSGGEDMESVGWYSKNSGKQTHPVGLKHPNVLGLYDMSGNVFEWCSDWYGEKYYAESPEENPAGVAYEQAMVSGSFFARCRVMRGGSWHQDTAAARVTARGYYLPARKWYNIGFRVVYLPSE